MEFKWCRLDGVREATSSITFRTVRVNESDKFYVAPDGPFDRVPGILASFLDDHCAGMTYASRPRKEFEEFLGPLGAARTAEQFAEALDGLIDWVVETQAAKDKAGDGQGGRLMDLYVRFHAEGLIALPPTIPYAKSAKVPRYEWSWGGNYPVFREAKGIVEAHGGNQRHHEYKFRWILRLFLCCHGAKEFGDLTPEVDGGLLFKTTGGEGVNQVPAVAKVLLSLMRASHPNKQIEIDPTDYGTNKGPSRTDGTFAWVEAIDPALKEWGELAAKWVQVSASAFAPNNAALNQFIDFLSAHPDLPRNPLEFVRRRDSDAVADDGDEAVADDGDEAVIDDLTVRFKDWLVARGLPEKNTLRGHINRTSDFIDWILAEYCSLDGVVSPKYWNPFRRLEYQGTKKNETGRSALPMRFIRMLKDIIRAPYTIAGTVPEDALKKLLKLKYTKDDQGNLVGNHLPDSVKKLVEDAGGRIEYGFAWPQSQRDFVQRQDPVTGAWTQVWSPVRSYFTLLKLELPLRSFQAIVLESSEADAETYDPVRGWVANPARPEPASEQPRFALRRMVDANSGDEFVGLFINTNKTRDQASGAVDRGYEIPWEHREAIRLITELEAWQRRFNPIAKPVPWTKVAQLERRFTQAQLASRPPACFLFRDPDGDDPAYPPDRARLDGYWENLLTELEKRVWSAGMRLRNGNRIVFVDENVSGGKKPGKYRTPRYDLHSLRVSLITAFAEIGVPIGILSKFVAGHATIVMTLYYAKFGPAHVTEVMNEAGKRIEEQEKSQYQRFLTDASYKEIMAYAATNDPVAVEMVKKNDPGAWVVGDLGICPVGCSRCHEGGEPIRERSSENHVHGPVPGGEQNCVRCRFFITGPAFIIGLNAHFNAVGYKLMEQSRRYRDLEQKLESLEEEQYACEAERRPFLQGENLESTSKAFSRDGAVLDETANNWHATHRLLARCFAAVQSDGKPTDGTPGSGMALVLAGSQKDLRAALRSTSDFELADAVCQSAVFYESVDAQMPNLRRADIINAMLAANHRRPIFSFLSDEEKLTVGNEMVKFLIARTGYEDTMALMAGRKALDALSKGLGEEFDRMVEGKTGQPIHIDYTPPSGRATLAIEGGVG